MSRDPVATLAESVCHDLNNPLAYIVSNLRFCQETLAKPTPPTTAQLEELRSAIRDVAKGIDGVRAIVTKLSALATAPPTSP